MLRARRAGRRSERKFRRAVTDSGTRDRARRRTSPGITNLIEILAAVRGVAPEAVERGVRRRRATATSRPRWPTRWSTTWRRCASATPSCAPTRPALEALLAAGRREGAGDRLGDARRRARRRWASGPSRLIRRPARLAFGVRGRRATSAASSSTSTSSPGPFDLLLSLVLREELDLLEVDLADVVLAYLDHLEARDELDLEAATEFLVLIAALLELKSRLMLPGEEVEELDELGARRGGRGAAGADAALRALPRRRPAGWRRAARREQAALLPRGAAAAGAAPRARWTRAEAAYAPDVLGAGARRAAAHARRRSTCATSRAPRVVGGRAPGASCAACCAAGSFSLRRGGARRRPRDRRRHAVRAARALQARRGGAGSRTSRSAPITVAATRRRAGARSARVTALARTLEALLFLAPDPVALEDLADATRRVRRTRSREALRRAAATALDGPRRRAARGRRRLDARRRDPAAEDAARRLLAAPAHAAADPRAGRDARRSSPTCSPSRGPRSRASAAWLGVGDRGAGRARADRGGGPLAVRRRALPHDAAVPQAVRPALARRAARPRAVGPVPRGAGRAARPPAARRRGARRAPPRPAEPLSGRPARPRPRGG